MSTPPYPRTAPAAGAATPVSTSTHKTGGGFRPAANVAFNKTTIINGNSGGGIGGQPGASQGNGGKIPGSDFMSNEDIHAFCEYLRKEARNRATERAMDADHLGAVLRTIPDVNGSLSGARARARRVARWLKKIAAAEKAIQKYSAMLYGTFEREFESDLRKVGKGRAQDPRATKFGWR